MVIMIKLKSVFFSLLLALSACAQVWAVESYRKVTTSDDLVDGANYILVTKLQSAAYAPGTLGNSVFARVEITFESDIAIIDQNSGVTVFTLQKTNDGYAFMNNGQYLYSPEIKKVGFREEETSWQVTAQSGGFAISPSAGYLQYNASSPRFTVYTSGQTPAYLYVKSDEYSSIMPPVISGTTPFKHSTTVSISAKAGETIYYTLDGTEPTTSSAVYTAPFELVESTQVKAIAQNGEQTITAQALNGYSVGQFAKAGDQAYIYPMRAYLVHNGAGGSQKNAGGLGGIGELPETIDLKIMDENGVVTETASLNTRTGEIKRDLWFDLQGRKLNGKPAEKGKYLHNGRVEVVK